MGQVQREAIADVAWNLLSIEGESALTMRRIAAALGVSAPSLYKHVADREGIIALVQERTLVEGATHMQRAISRAQSNPALAAALAYRRWAVRHPAQYLLTNARPLLRDRLPPDVESRAADVVLRLAEGDVTRARVMWATAHGLISLELAGRFPRDADLEAAWRAAFNERPVRPAKGAGLDV
jgi:AcrR family transcriptional regulator